MTIKKCQNISEQLLSPNPKVGCFILVKTVLCLTSMPLTARNANSTAGSPGPGQMKTEQN